MYCLFRNYLPLENGPSFEQTLIPITQGCFVRRLVETGPGDLEKKIFKISSMYLRFFVIISPWKRVWIFIWTNLNLFHSRMHCAKFGWNWPSSFWEDESVKRQMDNRQSEKLTWAFSSCELKRFLLMDFWMT